MKIRLFVKFAVKPQNVDAFIQYMQAAKLALKEVPGCEDVELIQSAENPSQIVLAEIWESKEIHDQYAAKMAESGAMGGLMPLLDGAPETEVFYLK